MKQIEETGSVPMADKTLRVESNAEPTFWNYTAAKGAAIGSLLLSIPGGIIGGIIGGFVGKSRMHNEYENGKKVAPPTSWNRTALIGAAITAVAARMTLGAIYG